MNDLAYVDIENDGTNNYLEYVHKVHKIILEEAKKPKNYIS